MYRLANAVCSPAAFSPPWILLCCCSAALGSTLFSPWLFLSSACSFAAVTRQNSASKCVSHVIAGALIFTNKVFIHVHTSKLLKNLLRYNKKWLFHEPSYAVKKRPKYVNGSHIDINIQQDVYLHTLISFYKHGLFLAEPGREIEIATSKLTTMCLKYW